MIVFADSVPWLVGGMTRVTCRKAILVASRRRITESKSTRLKVLVNVSESERRAVLCQRAVRGAGIANQRYPCRASYVGCRSPFVSSRMLHPLRSIFGPGGQNKLALTTCRCTVLPAMPTLAQVAVARDVGGFAAPLFAVPTIYERIRHAV